MTELLLLLLSGAGAALAVAAAVSGARRRVNQQALRDALTGLPRRQLMEGRLEVALARGRRQGFTVVLLFVDLDRFSAVNESLGYRNGDRVLRAVVDRMARALREEDTVARLEGDEFVILLEQVAGPVGAAKAAQRVIDLFGKPFEVEGGPVSVSASIGVSVSSDGHGSVQDLLRNAALARQRAKEKGRSRYEIFEPGMREEAGSRLAMEHDLRQAIEATELELRYQPEVRLDTGRVTGLEALVRWRHPAHGLLEPDSFIPLAEETGFILELGRWVLLEACRAGVRLSEHELGSGPLQMSVNVSARQLESEGTLVSEVREVLGTTGLAPEVLRVEVTESALIQHVERAVETVRDLRNMGVAVAIDDFGTGYSSLSYLKHFPVSTLKLDKSFVQGVLDPVDSAIVASVIGLAESLGMAVTAEGIECQDQLTRLRDLGCLVGQGFYLSSPVSEESVLRLLDGSRWEVGAAPATTAPEAWRA
ncbi:MAG TPA: bifunctional diguanylate cyclase/phosphodiesterase [bacterium]|nr:bifunctional diguanylate cyclase/phosphodiesterase [bacterium]